MSAIYMKDRLIRVFYFSTTQYSDAVPPTSSSNNTNASKNKTTNYKGD